MIGQPEVEDIQPRLAKHYLGRRHAAEAAYQRGHKNSVDGLCWFDQEWLAAHTSADDEIAPLCKEYPQTGVNLLLLRQHPHKSTLNGWKRGERRRIASFTLRSDTNEWVPLAAPLMKPNKNVMPTPLAVSDSAILLKMIQSRMCHHFRHYIADSLG